VSIGTLHVTAALTAVAVGGVLLSARKGTRRHVHVGRLYVAAMLAATVPVLWLYDSDGRPGPFHILAIVSLVTLAGGIAASPSRSGSTESVRAHGTFMLWSYAGLTGAGVAQAANATWPRWSPWPVVAVVLSVVVAGFLIIPRVVPSDHHGRPDWARPRELTRPGRALRRGPMR